MMFKLCAKMENERYIYNANARVDELVELRLFALLHTDFTRMNLNRPIFLYFSNANIQRRKWTFFKENLTQIVTLP